MARGIRILNGDLVVFDGGASVVTAEGSALADTTGESGGLRRAGISVAECEAL